jgi:hypothetical protein
MKSGLPKAWRNYESVRKEDNAHKCNVTSSHERAHKLNKNKIGRCVFPGRSADGIAGGGGDVTILAQKA